VPIPNEDRNHATVNPVVETATTSPSPSAGCSNAVTPVPHYIPRLFDIEWLLGAVAFVHALLDPGDRLKRRHQAFTSVVHETIDMNGFLPTSYDDMAEWRTVVGGPALRN